MISSSSCSHPVLAVGLSAAEFATFFPGEQGRELLALAGGADAHFDCTLHSADEWAAWLARRRPAVVVSHWSTHPLPVAAFAHVRYVAHMTGSVRRLVPREVLAGGALVTNWGDCAAEPVAEATLTLILAGLRQTQFWGREMHERGVWRGDVGTATPDYGDARTLFDRRVALHGFGRIARALLSLLRPFRVSCVAYSRGVPPDYMRSFGVEPVDSLDALCATAPDVFVEVEALTPDTAGSVQARHLGLLPTGSLFVNTGRGAVVDEAALHAEARAGRLRLAFDVYATEPLPADSPFRGPAHVTLMPHLGGPTPDLYPAMGRRTLDNLRRWQRGEPLPDQVDLANYDRST